MNAIQKYDNIYVKLFLFNCFGRLHILGIDPHMERFYHVLKPHGNVGAFLEVDQSGHPTAGK